MIHENFNIMEQNVTPSGSSKDSDNEFIENNETLTPAEVISHESNSNQIHKECEISEAINSNDDQDMCPLSSRSFSVLTDKQNNKLEYKNTKHPVLRISSSVNVQPNYPKSIYLLALSKLHENSLSLTNEKEQNVSQFDNRSNINRINCIKSFDSGLETPNSLTSAPPSYSFVLQQMARRRPRLMGTFIPSPSFVLHTPPPNYTTAFDIYIDSPIPPPPRVYRFGYMPMLIMCPECGYVGVTTVTSKITLSTHLCALVLCLLCCLVCAPLPYLLRSCKEVYHYCKNCRMLVGMYCPTNPQNST